VMQPLRGRCFYKKYAALGVSPAMNLELLTRSVITTRFEPTTHLPECVAGETPALPANS
jgi:hypothetical protein